MLLSRNVDFRNEISKVRLWSKKCMMFISVPIANYVELWVKINCYMEVVVCTIHLISLNRTYMFGKVVILHL